MARISKDMYFLTMASVCSLRATCIRRSVGCVIVNKRYHILSTGYNGTPAGIPHCIDSPCKGAHYESGQGLGLCEAIHAEQNALLQCPDTYDIFACYTTISPCIHCLKLLMNTSCEKIIFLNAYPNYKELQYKWENSSNDIKREMIQLKDYNITIGENI